MTQPLLRFGIHNFLNAGPLLLPLEEQGANMGFQVITDSPTALADRLKSSDLDLAVIPSVEYFKLAESYRLVSDVCIASRGEVGTVLFLTKKPINEIRSIAADNRSRTSVALLKILFSLYAIDTPVTTLCVLPDSLLSMLKLSSLFFGLPKILPFKYTIVSAPITILFLCFFEIAFAFCSLQYSANFLGPKFSSKSS